MGAVRVRAVSHQLIGLGLVRGIGVHRGEPFQPAGRAHHVDETDIAQRRQGHRRQAYHRVPEVARTSQCPIRSQKELLVSL